MSWEKIGKKIKELYEKDIVEILVLENGLTILFVEDLRNKHLRIFSLLEEARPEKQFYISVQPYSYDRDDEEIETVRIVVMETEENEI